MPKTQTIVTSSGTFVIDFTKKRVARPIGKVITTQFPARYVLPEPRILTPAEIQARLIYFTWS